ncbi:MAG: YfhO family protein [Chloroflexi bacterium]|nr:YfhO family protein [Chloroflexota bacterium]
METERENPSKSAFIRVHQRPLFAGLLAWTSLALVTLVMLWPLGLTNRVLAGVDALTYFTPYWAYRMAELAAGHIPLWNSYLFLGVPFLANPQAAVLYPLHWPLSWLRPEQALVWSALIHVWLAAGFTYTFGRRSLRLSWTAAWLAGAIFGFGGFTLARVENINQLNALAWLPASLWLLDETARAGGWRPRIRWGSALAVVLALQILAGHTQTLFINGVGIGLWAAYPLVRQAARHIGRLGRGKLEADRARRHSPPAPPLPCSPAPHLPILLAALVLALLLSAAQLLPTLELNGLGLRTGGLPYRQAVSFSLRPRLLIQTFFPPFGGGLAEAFGSEGYAEFAGWISVTGVALAGVGIVSMRRAWRKSQIANRKWASDELQADTNTQYAVRSTQYPIPNTQYPLLLLVAAGLFLALGAYNPFYYLLWRFVPGFDLFRAPARWLALYAIGMAGLAGLGLDVLAAKASLRHRVTLSPHHPVTLSPRHLVTLSPRHLVTVFPCLLVLLELWLGARALPFALAAAPSALSLRNAPAALLSASRSIAATADQPTAGRDRFLSMSDIRFDPGDLAELRALQADRLPADAVERTVRAAKQTEVIAPNLPLLWRLPAVDGYDGGTLPLDRYVKLQGLFLPSDSLSPDGRLREQLREIPDGRLLDLTGVRFVITDKQNDLWADNVYYDLQLPARIEAGRALTLDLSSYPSFSATALGLVAEVASGVPDGVEIAEVRVDEATGNAATLPLRAGPETRGGPTPTRLPLAQPLTPARIIVRVPAEVEAPVILRGLSLIDERTGAHASVTVSQRGDFRRIHSGDVKVYERQGAPGRAWLVHGVQPVADDATALATLADPAFDPRTAAVVAGDVTPRPAGAVAPGEGVTIVAWDAERIALRAEAAAPAVLVLADAFYPGWQATVDAAPATLLRTNFMFRGVALEPGNHEVVFTYAPASWRWGVCISLATLALLIGALLATCVLRAACCVLT